MAAQLAEVRYQNELARIDREWAIEREKYMVTGQHGRRIIPTTGAGIGSAIGIGVVGVIWTIMSFAITGGAPDEGPFAIAKLVFPLFGVAVTVGGIVMGIYVFNKAEVYNAAFAEFQRRRAAVKPIDFH